ncbi:alkane 1-monooxygenase [Roseivivax isoporae]|uniref:Alkanal monooxygenase n=1 Tax=Roseivivax isoporae LMG 25204 TaxID=1449351 RepID=X7F676_9RHOB|nr:alkane 1-monooxygenase [Roseivivax isoporae]ETX27576.1 alkanal monooxygenase [Roseivivax isoporae LMG 25204]
MRFATITLLMAALLGAGLAAGGPLLWAALAYIALVTWALDRIAALAAPDMPGREFPAGTLLSATLGLLHLPLLFGGVAALAGPGLSLPEKAAGFVALGLFLGQVGNSNAHELIHRGHRGLRRLGAAVFVTLLFGHHASAHPKVHHVHVATDRDPNSARLGEGFWHFARRAWIGSLREGYRAEAALRRGRGGTHPYLFYGAGAAACLAGVAALGGLPALAVYVGLAAYAQLQLLLSDYVQHYGLRRAEIAPGRFEPVGARHSWNAVQGVSAGLMLNAPRHSDHHAHPGRPYPGLRLDRDRMPILPHALPVMATAALVPPLWRRLMDRRARAWAKHAPSGFPPAPASAKLAP